MRDRLVIAALALGLGACIADPMPSPGDKAVLAGSGGASTVAAPDGANIVVSAASAAAQDAVDVIGLLGLKNAVSGAGFVVLTQLQTNTVTVVKSTSDGTFAAVLAASAGTHVEVTFETSRSGPESDPIDLSIDTSRTNSPAPPATSDQSGATGGGAADGGTTGPSAGFVAASAPVASAPNAQGVTHVTGGGLTPNQMANVGNVRTGEVETTVVPQTGEIDVALGAQAGDTILVIVRDPATNLTSEVTSLTVPAPP